MTRRTRVQNYTSACLEHFSQRVAERAGPDVDAKVLWSVLIERINQPEPTPYLTFIARINKQGRRLWKIEVGDRVFFIVYDHRIDCPITLLPPSGYAKRQCGEPISLEAHL